METQYQIVSDIPDDLLEIYLQKPYVAVDTELHGLTLYRDQICLIQVGDDAENVCLVRPKSAETAPNLRRLMTDPSVLKIFHFALTDVGFFQTSLNIQVAPFCCTKVMSKLIRTYTSSHGLKHLCKEFLNVELEKESQQTNWASNELSNEQLKYAARDVLYLVKIYEALQKMMEERPALSTGQTVKALNEKAQATLPVMVDLMVHGYGDGDHGWKTTLFEH